MIPGKQYRPEDVLAIAWRHKWLILVPLVVSALGTFLYSRTLPNVYRSEATVLIVPQQVPENYVRPTVDDRVKDRLEFLRRQILSRPRLERIIEELNLYPVERKQLLMDQVIERMRLAINLTVGKAGRRQDPNNFVVSFDSDNPQTAMLVAERLAAVFIRENTEGRNVQTDATLQFMQSQVDEALRQLQQQETRLEAFKRANAGRLPDQAERNLQLLQNARQEIQLMTDGVNRDRDRLLTLERTIADEVAFASVAPSKPAGGGEGAQANQSAAQQLASAKAALDVLLLRLKEDHPDVRIARNRIADLERKAEAEALAQPVSGSGPAPVLTPADVERQRRLTRLRGEASAVEGEIRAKQARLQRAQQTLQDNERRLQSAPALEAQMADLMRDAGTYKNNYDTLLQKLQNAKLAASLEQRQVGEQFRIIEPARRPEQPRSPDRVRMNLIGAALGLGFGLAIVALLEYRDTSLRTEEDVLVALALPVLALVPTMTTRREFDRRRRRLLLVGSSTAAMIVISLVAVAWKLRLFERWGG